MYAQPHLKVLHGRYELLRPLFFEHMPQSSESWIALDLEEREFLTKLWPFTSEEANNLQRALWDAELRTMYRVSSSPGAEAALMVIREAGLDRESKCFVMVMQAREAGGYTSLYDVVRHRADYTWLSTDELETRRELWTGLKRIAQGIRLLHEQNVLHRNVSVENVFVDSEDGPPSFRLAGFEWSVRVGELHLQQPPTNWSCPPEFYTSFSGYQPETDWYGFGILAVRCLLNLEGLSAFNPSDRHNRVLSKIENTTSRSLSDLEKTVLQRLIARRRSDRLMRGYEVLSAIDEVLESLWHGPRGAGGDRPLILAYDPENLDLIDRISETGFVPNPERPGDTFVPRDPLHRINLSQFLRDDFREAQLYAVGRRYLLVGRQLGLFIRQFEDRDPQTREKNPTWDAAYCGPIAELRQNIGGTACREIPPGSIVVRPFNEVRRESLERRYAQSWAQYLPYVDKAEKQRANLDHFLDFIRCTNQIELLMRDAELFAYEVLAREVESGTEILEVREVARDRNVLDILRLEGGMIEFLQRELESGKPNSDLVLLTPKEQAALRFGGKRIEEKEGYRIREIRTEDKVVVLDRNVVDSSMDRPSDSGWLRAFGMFGQVELIRRRKDAIDRLTDHSYLLRSLYTTGQVFMDTEDVHLPQPVQTEKVDIAKQAAMQDVLRTRPIYTLQGPPGTGKTTMVAHLLRQIFTEDPVAQVLVTAQAHGAVDVLRAKVRDEAFADVDEAKQPLAIRLRRESTEGTMLEGSVEDVAMQCLRLALKDLSEQSVLSPIQKEWQQRAQEMLAAIGTRTTGQKAPEFVELVKRGANITYCTTSAGDLEELARTTQFYDWTIIEEAGKCHGFDLALPLQAGHRWLLIGDQRQLAPYRVEDYDHALRDLNRVVEALKELPDNAGDLLDRGWIDRWEGMREEERGEFRTFALDWLRTFDKLFRNCRAALPGERQLTIEESIGAAAGMLSHQYRMHPTIGTLISQAFYDGMLVNQTVDRNGMPLDRVTCPVEFPKSIRDAAIVWLDTPAAFYSTIAQEHGPQQRKPRYTNPYEADVIETFLWEFRLDQRFLDRLRSGQEVPLKLAVLSPYTQQVVLVRHKLSDVPLPEGVIPKKELRTKRSEMTIDRPRLVHTVDAFQGNEADVVVISLVRNNTGEHGKPLGFLEEPQRMNVLLSRAQRLLVLVGSWDFFYKQTEMYSLDSAPPEIRHLKIVVTLLGDWFKSGEAVKLDARSLMEVNNDHPRAS